MSLVLWIAVRSLNAYTHKRLPVGCVLANAEFDSERNHAFVRKQLHALSIIPAKRGEKKRGPFMASELKCDTISPGENTVVVR